MATRRNNGKRNGKPRKMHPNSLANLNPPQKPGDPSLNPSGRTRKRGLLDELLKYFDEETRYADGARVIGGRFLKGPTDEVNDQNWRFCAEKVLERLCPAPREPATIIGNVNVEHTSLCVSFVQQVREATGRDNLSSDDVLKALEQEAFDG